MKILIATSGSRGDVQPSQALGLGLIKAGHSVRLAAPPDFAESSRALGLEFVPVGSNSRAVIKEHFKHQYKNPITAIPKHRRMFAFELKSAVEPLLNSAADVDMVLGSSLQLMAHAVARYHKLPYRYFFPTLTVLPATDYPPWALPIFGLGKGINKILWWGVNQAFNDLSRTELRPELARLGLRVNDSSRYVFSNRPIVTVDKCLNKISAENPYRAVQTSALTLPPQKPLSNKLEQFLQDGTPPVYFGFGSMHAANNTRFSRGLVGAIKELGIRAIISRGWGDIAKGVSEESIFIADDEPHELLFPRCSCIVHHCGAGTTAAALRSGVPQLAVPHVLDQPHTAMRLFKIGTSARPLLATRLNTKRLIGRLKIILEQESFKYRARELRDELLDTNGVSETIKEILG